jgi:two-component system, LytTR family, response regulator
MRCIAIDDEPIALDIIRAHAAKVPGLTLVCTFVSATEALAFLQQEPVDLILLDINMPDITGLELAKVIGGKTRIIFTTAFAEFAVNGFDLGVDDFLLKPISFSRFLQACTRARERHLHREHTSPATADKQDYLFVKTGYEWERVNLDELLYIVADDNYLTFHTPAKKILTRMKLSEILEKLPTRHFTRVHRSYAVALAKIEKIERHQVTIAGQQIPVSANYRDNLLQLVSC